MEKYHSEPVFDEPQVSDKANRGGETNVTEEQTIFDDAEPLKEKERSKRRGGASEIPEQTIITKKEQVSVNGSP